MTSATSESGSVTPLNQRTSLCSRGVTGVTAGQDLIGRIGAGIVMTATFAPALLRDSVRERDTQSLEFYRAAGRSGDPSRILGAPSSDRYVMVGLTGLSLGGLLSALVAETDERAHFAIPNAPPTDFGETSSPGGGWARVSRRG